MSRIITLLTDFGYQDGYVGAMKGVILGINPRAVLVDISHEIEPHDITAGALVLADASGWFPSGTIHVAVVDPGVGSQRRPIVVETSRGYYVGPDNGIFSIVYERETVLRTVALENPRFMAPSISRTFHGRDIFAPAAAFLSLGVAVDALGPPVQRGVVMRIPRPRVRGDAVWGEVIHVDRFGNLVTNISEDAFKSFVGGGDKRIWIGSERVAGLRESYEEGEEDEVFGIFGSSGFLEISMKRRSACSKLGVGRGASVRVERSLKGGVES
ncbi:MAG: SAM-dependent chlorinase/fluorinase [Deltaproteobacteria bacterium]|nr:SAM-dependent chlorinase/fluorinase [Deltaproteobacteria bacterium]